MEGIPKDVLLGEDALALQDRRALVVTRRQKKARDEREAIVKQNELASGVRAIPVEELPTLSEAEESDDDFDEEVESPDESNSASNTLTRSMKSKRLFDEDNLNDWRADDVNSESECNDTSHDASALDEPFDETSSDLSDISDDEESDDVTSKSVQEYFHWIKCQQEYAEILRLDRDKLRELQSADLTLAKVEHDVITTDETPICQKPYRLPQAAKQTVKEELQKMLKAGIITESKSPYASPLV
ncbi:uncharacterized protein [Ptychodera flava]|uniref:uncharacterized protein n=1 Tax=Ptychodera flava TaxID=63121 RepID=UPI00396A0D2F